MSDAQDTFGQWRVYILKTLEKVSQEVEALKHLTHSREEYIERFRKVETELLNLQREFLALAEKLSEIDKQTAVSARLITIYAGLGGAAASAAVGVIYTYFVGR